MNGYVIGGYVLSIGSLVTYGGSIVSRERAARRRLDGTVSATGEGTAEGSGGEWSAPPEERA